MKKFTVIGVYEETGQIVSHHVTAKNDFNAFAVMAKREHGISMVAAIPGHLNEGSNITFPGVGLVGSDTILEQPEVFGTVEESAGESNPLSRLVFFEAYACGDANEGPTFAKLLVDDDFCDKLQSLRQFVVDNKLSEIRVYNGPNSWGPGNVEEELRFDCAEMVVASSAFWFVDQPKHADYHVETRIQDIDAFLEKVSQGSDTLYFGDDPEELQQLVEEDAEPSEFKYLIGANWSHVFEGFGEKQVRFVFDVESRTIVSMQVFFDQKWQNATQTQVADVQDSLITANEEALQNPAEWGLLASAELPDWSVIDSSTPVTV